MVCRAASRWLVLAGAGAFIACCGGGVGADQGPDYPRLSLGTYLAGRWVADPAVEGHGKNALGYLLKFDEIYGHSELGHFKAVIDSARANGHDDWADRVQIIQNIQVAMGRHIALEQEGRFEPEDQCLVDWIHEAARGHPEWAIAVAAFYNKYFHGVDWFMHDTVGDTIAAWTPNFEWLYMNISPWCPRGAWDGTVVKASTGEVVDLGIGSTVGKTYTEWLCEEMRDRVIIDNPEYREVIDGVQLECSALRTGPYYCGHFNRPDLHPRPDPARDGVGAANLEQYMDLCRVTHDSLFTHFLQPIMEAGLITRSNGHLMRARVDPSPWIGEDPLQIASYLSSKFENYGDWGGWPHDDSTKGYWFKCYEKVEEVRQPTGQDAREGWDTSVLQSKCRVSWPQGGRAKWTRLNLGQCLMGDGYFNGNSFYEDLYHTKYVRETGANWQSFEPVWIEEMGHPLGYPVGEFAEYRAFPTVKPLYYRHFTDPNPGGTPIDYTVVVNIWPWPLAGVPGRDAMWYYGHHIEFPGSKSLLVFNHWPELSLPPAWSIVRVGTRGGLDTTIRFELPDHRMVSLAVYDITGREVRRLIDHRMGPGSHEVTWDGRDRSGIRMGGGVYLWSMEAESFRDRGRMILVR